MMDVHSVFGIRGGEEEESGVSFTDKKGSEFMLIRDRFATDQ
jgi:hypothetical protein